MKKQLKAIIKDLRDDLTEEQIEERVETYSKMFESSSWTYPEYEPNETIIR